MKKILYWAGISRVNFELFSAHKDKIKRLLHGETKSVGANFKQEIDGYRIYGLELNYSDRLLYTTIKWQGKSYLLLLEVIDQHDYQKSRFLQPGVLKQFIAKKAEALEETLPLAEVLEEKVDEEVSFEPVYAYQKQFIRLDNQQLAALEVSKPNIISGPPGSGKSCVVMALLSQAVMQAKYNRIVCVTKSVELVDNLRLQWRRFPESYGDEAVSFIDYESLIKAQLGERAKDLIWLSQEEVCSWLNDKLNEDAIKRRYPELLTYDGAGLYQEWCTLSHVSAAQYQDFGVRQSSVDKAHRASVYQLFIAYQAYLEKIGAIHLPFYTLVEPVALAERIIVDEAQDFSVCELINLAKLTGGNEIQDYQISYALDTHQSLLAARSVRPLLQQALASLVPNKPIPHTQLLSSYRCPAAIASMANQILAIKNTLLGGVGDKEEFAALPIPPEQMAEGGVQWYDAGDWPAEDVKAWLAQLKMQWQLKDTEIAIVTAPQWVDRVKQTTQHMLVYTPKQIKGLEYPGIIAYQPFSHPDFKTVSQHLPADLNVNPHRSKDKEGTHEALGPKLNGVFVTFTRGTKVLVVVQAAEKDKRILLWHVKQALPKVKQAAAVKAEDSPKIAPVTAQQDWYKEFKRVLAVDKALAKAIYHEHLQTRFGVNFEDYLLRKTKKLTQATSPAVTEPPSIDANNSATMPSSVFKKKKKRRAKKKESTASLSLAVLPTVSPIAPSTKPLPVLINTLKDRLIKKSGNLSSFLTKDDGQQFLQPAVLRTAIFESMAEISRSDHAQNFEDNLVFLIIQYPSLCREVFTTDIFTNPWKHAERLKLPNDDIFSLLCNISLRGESFVIRHWIHFQEQVTESMLFKLTIDKERCLSTTPFYLLCLENNFIGLIKTHWAFWEKMLTPTNLSQAVIGREKSHGATHFYWLCKNVNFVDLLMTHWFFWVKWMTPENLFKPITGKSKEKGLTPFYWLCQTQKGLEMLFERWHHFKPILTSQPKYQNVFLKQINKTVNLFERFSVWLRAKDLLAVTQNNGLLKAKLQRNPSEIDWSWDAVKQLTPAVLEQAITDCMHEINQARLAYNFTINLISLLSNCWMPCGEALTTDILSKQWTHEDVLHSNNQCLFFMLCEYLDRTKQNIVIKNWDFLQPRLNPSILLHRQGDKKLTSVHVLCNKPGFAALLQTHWDFWVNILTTEVLFNPLTRRGVTLFEALCAHQPDFSKVLQTHWDFWVNLLTPENSSQFNKRINPRVFYNLSIHKSFIDLLRVHWDFWVKLLTPKYLFTFVFQKNNDGVSAFFGFCCSANFIDCLRERWDFWVNYLTEENLLKPIPELNNLQGETPFMRLCWQAGFNKLLKDNWDFWIKFMTPEVLLTPIPEGPLKGRITFYYLSHYEENLHFIFEKWEHFRPMFTDEQFNSIMVLNGSKKTMTLNEAFGAWQQARQNQQAEIPSLMTESRVTFFNSPAAIADDGKQVNLNLSFAKDELNTAGP